MLNALHGLMIVLLAALALSSPAASQEIYKWTDEDGIVHYGDDPPTGSVRTSEIVREKPPPQPNNILTTSKTVGVSKIADITRYALFVGEEYAPTAKNVRSLVPTKDRLWITYSDKVVSFDPTKNEATKYDFAHLNLNVFEIQISNHYLVIRSRNKLGTTSELNIYDLWQDLYYTIPLDNPYSNLVPYNDHYNDGLFMFDQKGRTLIKHGKVPIPLGVESVDTVKYPMNTLSYVQQTSMTMDSAWFLGSGKESCLISLLDKGDGNVTTFSYKEMGLLASDRCVSIVADHKEVWISVRKSLRRFDADLLVYDIEAATWELLDKRNDGLEFTVSQLWMDAEHVYSRNRGCSQITAMDRKSRNMTAIDLDDYEFEPRDGGGCVDKHTLFNGHLWSLKFASRGRQKYPVLYKVPLDTFSP